MYITVQGPEKQELIDRAVAIAILSRFTSVELLDEVKRRLSDDK